MSDDEVITRGFNGRRYTLAPITWCTVPKQNRLTSGTAVSYVPEQHRENNMGLTKRLNVGTRKKIAKLLDQGQRIKQVANAVGVSDSSVRRVKKSMKLADAANARATKKAQRKSRKIVSTAPKSAPPASIPLPEATTVVRVQTALSFYKPETLHELHEELRGAVDRNANVTLAPMRAWACVLALEAVGVKS